MLNFQKVLMKRIAFYLNEGSVQLKSTLLFCRNSCLMEICEADLEQYRGEEGVLYQKRNEQDYSNKLPRYFCWYL